LAIVLLPEHTLFRRKSLAVSVRAGTQFPVTIDTPAEGCKILIRTISGGSIRLTIARRQAYLYSFWKSSDFEALRAPGRGKSNQRVRTLNHKSTVIKMAEKEL